MSFDNLNIVLMGSNFPIDTIRATDFAFPNAVVDMPRLPMVAIVQAAPFILQVLPVRFQVSATTGDNLEDTGAILVRNALIFCEEYIGPRAVTAVGHNMQSHILVSRLSRTEIHQRLFNVDTVRALVDDEHDLLADAVLQFKRGSADYVRLSVITTGAPPDRVVVDFNFNFDMGGDRALPLREVIQLFPESLTIAQDLSERLPAVLDMQEAR